MLYGFNFSKRVFFVNSSFYVLKRQWFSHFSIPGTYTLDVLRTPNQSDNDVTLPRSSYCCRPRGARVWTYSGMKLFFLKFRVFSWFAVDFGQTQRNLINRANTTQFNKSYRRASNVTKLCSMQTLASQPRSSGWLSQPWDHWQWQQLATAARKV